MDFHTHIFLLILPMVLANILHMIVVKMDWLSILSISLSKSLFGKNKTLRGFIVLPLLSGGLVGLFSQMVGPFSGSLEGDVGIGIGLGLCYLLSELPNSYIKRRLGIANGEHSKNYKWFQILMDKSDSLIGMLIFYFFIMPYDVEEILLLYLLSLGISLMTSFILFALKIKKSF